MIPVSTRPKSGAPTSNSSDSFESPDSPAGSSAARDAEATGELTEVDPREADALDDLDHPLPDEQDEIAVGGHVLLISHGRRAELYQNALENAGHVCDRVRTVEEAVARMESSAQEFDLLLWDAQDDGGSLDAALDRGRFAPPIPALLLADRAYPFLEASARPGWLEFIVRPYDANQVAQAASRNVAVRVARRKISDIRRRLDQAIALLSDAGGRLSDARVARGPAPGDDLPITEREREVMRLMAEGRRPADIAKQLDLSVHTVRNHLKSIFRRLGVRSRIEALARCRGRL